MRGGCGGDGGHHGSWISEDIDKWPPHVERTRHEARELVARGRVARPSTELRTSHNQFPVCVCGAVQPEQHGTLLAVSCTALDMLDLCLTRRLACALI